MKLLFENWRKFVNEACCPDKISGANVDLHLKPSEIHGKGIFAGEKIPKGTDLGTSHVRKNGMWTIPDLGRWHNHSDSPSCHNTLDGSMEDKTYTRNLIASRDIEPGEEITVDYRLQADLEQPGSWAINEYVDRLKKMVWHSGDAATTAKGVSDDDEILTGLGIAGFIFTSPIQAAAITLGSLVYGNGKASLEEFNNLPDDHPRKIAHKKYVEQCPNCHRLSGKSREQAEIASGLVTAEQATKINWKSEFIKQEIKNVLKNPYAREALQDPKKREEAFEKLKAWIQ